jgi:hypothetical protein
MHPTRRLEVDKQVSDLVEEKGDATRRGLAETTSPFDGSLPAGIYLPAAPAATAGVPTLTLICFGLASSRFGMFNVNTPFW